MINRRNFLKKAGQLTSLSLIPSQLIFPLSKILAPVEEYCEQKDPANSPLITKEIPLNFYNTHTGEWLKNIVFRQGNVWVSESLKQINKLFRDHRTGSIHPIDQSLLKILEKLKTVLNMPTHGAFHLVSGFRSSETNLRLREVSSGVARNSQHMYGKAADIFIPGLSMSKLAKAARSLRLGGVGCYGSFVHVDCGRVRSW